MDRFEIEAQYKRTLAELDALRDIEASRGAKYNAQDLLLEEAYSKVEEALGRL